MNKLLVLGALTGALRAMAGSQTGPGPYYWSQEWPGNPSSVDACATLTADQTWIVDGARTAKPFWPGTNNEFWQIWTGDSITVANGNDFRIMNGNVVFENKVISESGNNYIGYVNPAQLILRNGGSFHARRNGFFIGKSYNNGTNGNATVYMEEPSMVAGASGQSVRAGYDLPGALWMDGGLVSITNAALFVGSGHEGYVRLNGGTISTRSEHDAESLNVGNSSQYASLHISGGTLKTRKTTGSLKPSAHIGSGANQYAEVYADGGVLDLSRDRFNVGNWSNSTGQATLTVDGTAEVKLQHLLMGVSDKAGKSIVNLNGGTLYASTGLADYGKKNPTRQINFDGGTVNRTLNSNFPTTVYPGGGTIYVGTTESGTQFGVNINPRLATGYGVKTITLTNPGAGYVTAPRVIISGGSGTGATGYAVLAKDRTLEKVVVTCRGEGYAADDTLTVSFASTTGSGAAATATLAENGTGTLHKTGSGCWRQALDTAFDGEISIEEGTFATDGVSMTNLKKLRLASETNLNPARSETDGVTKESSVNRLDITDGIGRIGIYGNKGGAKLTIGSLYLENGFLHVGYTNNVFLSLTDASLCATSSSSSPIVNGMIYRNEDSTGYRSPSLYQRNADGSLSVIETTSTIAEEANFRPSASISSADAPTVSSLNCAILPLSPEVDCYVRNTGLVDVKSGMIVNQRSNEGGVRRFSVTGGGALTTRAPKGMFIYSDNYKYIKRSYSTANGSSVFFDNNRFIFGPFADPDASTPMTLTIAGVKLPRPELGTFAWLLADNNTYSGGLNLINGGAVIANTYKSLGKDGSPVRVAGYSSLALRGQGTGVSAEHPMTIAEKGLLIFSLENKTGHIIAASVSGSGELMTGDINRPGYALSFTGDHSAFTGDYYIQGHARMTPEVFSPNAGICLADGTAGIGVIECAGTIVRAPGIGKGELCWKEHDCYKTYGYGLRGGFAAVDGDLTVNLGGDARKLVVGSEYLPEGAVIQLQSQYANGALTVANGFELGGKTQAVSVQSGKQATLTGAVSDSVGGGQLSVTGNLAFAGTVEVREANLGNDAILSVDGDLDLTGANIDLQVSADEMADYKKDGLVVAMATGTVTGMPNLTTSLTGTWAFRVKDGQVSLRANQSTVITVR